MGYAEGSLAVLAPDLDDYLVENWSICLIVFQLVANCVLLCWSLDYTVTFSLADWSIAVQAGKLIAVF